MPRAFCVFSTISIHALREEGDGRNVVHIAQRTNFYPRPPRGGRRQSCLHGISLTYFYPRPPRGGRRLFGKMDVYSREFLSTPSARRATQASHRLPQTCEFLSTPSARRATKHRSVNGTAQDNFYPRPPRGGRLLETGCLAQTRQFLSTPSARRATYVDTVPGKGQLFLSTPSARRATLHQRRIIYVRGISIHALREEGDAGRSVHISQR